MLASVEGFSFAQSISGEGSSVLAWTGLTVEDLDASAEGQAIFSAEGRAVAVFAHDGRPLARTDDWAIAPALAAALVAETRRRRAAWVTESSLAEDGEDAVLLALAPADVARSWSLPHPAAAAAREATAGVVILAARIGDGPVASACRAFGLTGLQTRLAVESIRAGSIRLAAQSLGVSHDTAREAMSDALRRVGASRLPALVGQLTSLAFGILPDGAQRAQLDELWGLSTRQAQIAGLVAEGLSRRSVSEALGLSEAVVKKEVDRIYAVVSVNSAAALARRIAEAQALTWMTRATHGEIGALDSGLEPLRFVARPDGSRIALSDYGPASGRPVLVVHSSMSSRVVSRSLLRALHRAGFRPIAIDRPGFGLSDPVPGARAGAHDPYVTAVADACRVLDRLRVKQVDLVARGGAQFVMALARHAPERLNRIVLVNPDPPSGFSGRGKGPFAAFKAVYQQNPAMIRVAISVLSRHLTLERFSGALPQWVRGSPPDEAAVRDPETVRDYFRAMRMFATGRFEGYVNEQVDFAHGRDSGAPVDASGWKVLVAAHDTMHEPNDVMAYWTARLPGACVRRVEETGRFLAMSHPHLVIEALAEP